MPGPREALLDAAYEAMVSGEWDGTRMADVARAAGVSRQTLYNEFGSRDALAREVAERETARFLACTDAAFETGTDDLSTAIESGVAETLRLAAVNPLIKAVLTSPHDSEVTPFFTTQADVILVAAAEQLTRHLRSRWPDLDLGDVALVADSLPRLTLSHVMSPGAAPEVVARRITAVALRCLSRPAPTHRELP
nr:TetR family transcriptional regulator [Micromonospora sp. DSM 115978]